MHKELQRIRHGYYDLWFGTNAVYERWAKSHGLNNNLLLTLYLLKEFPNDCTQHLICEKLMLPKQTVNSILSDRKSTRLNSSHNRESRMPSSA